MQKANCLTTGGFISGEVKLVIAIRILAGDDSLDLAVMFDVQPIHILTIFDEVIEHCIIDSNIGNINISEVNDGFSKC